MKRTKFSVNKEKRLHTLAQDIVSVERARRALATKLGVSYAGSRKLYEALGYPQDNELNYDYYYGKWDRNDIARAVIDRPIDASWNSFQYITDAQQSEGDSQLKKAWGQLEKKLKLSFHLNAVDRLMGIGRYSVLLLGFNDTKTNADFKKPATGKLQLMYVKPVAEDNAKITEWEQQPNNPRYGKPLLYNISIGSPGIEGGRQSIVVHHSRVVHFCHSPLGNDVFGMPRLKPIVNRLVDIEKILGGDAEMFWRGARPGYVASAQEGYELTEDEIQDLEEEVRKYEDDLRRILTVQGVNVNALSQQVADPSTHLDIQLQAISAQTGIPKRVLVGAERGELASSHDKNQWLALLKTRMEDFVEPMILRPLIEKLMFHKLLPQVEDYVTVWEDLFAPSEKEKAEVGKIRADALKAYGDSISGQDLIPLDMAASIFLGLDDDMIEQLLQSRNEILTEDDRVMRQIQAQQPDPSQEQPGDNNPTTNESGDDDRLNSLFKNYRKPVRNKPTVSTNKRVRYVKI